MRNEYIRSVAVFGVVMIFAILAAGCSPASITAVRDMGNGTRQIVYEYTRLFGTITETITGPWDDEGRWHGIVEIEDSEAGRSKVEYQHGVRHGWAVGYGNPKDYNEITKVEYYEHGKLAEPPADSPPPVPESTGELALRESPASLCQSFLRLAGTRPWFTQKMDSSLDIGGEQVDSFLAGVETLVAAKNPQSDTELEAAFDAAVKELRENEEHKDTVGAYEQIRNVEVMNGLKSMDLRLAIFERVFGDGSSTYDILEASYPGFLDLMVSMGADLERVQALLDDVDERMDQMDPLDLSDPLVSMTIDERINKALQEAFEAAPHESSEIVLRPGPGNNDGTDDGSESAGKDAYAWACNGAYSGSEEYMAGYPRSTCNQCNARAYIQFNLEGLPYSVENVYLGVTHYPHTDVCYSMCSADFYFYPVLDPWDEMSIGTGEMPAEGQPVLGPLKITFPNDFGAQEYDITGIYKDWRTRGEPNHGLAIYSPDAGCVNAAVTFSAHSSDAPTEGLRPYLRVVYIDDPIRNAFILSYYKIYREKDPLFQAVKGWYWGSKGAVVYVSPDGTCLGNSPCYETLQAGIDAAGDGFSVRAKNGGYPEEVVLDDVKRIDLSGGYRSDFSSTGSPTTLRRLEITGGGASCSGIVVGPP